MAFALFHRHFEKGKNSPVPFLILVNNMLKNIFLQHKIALYPYSRKKNNKYF